MLVWILILYLYGLAANPRTIAEPKMLIALLAARWGPFRGAASSAPVNGREPDISPAAAPDPPVRSPSQIRSLRAPQAYRPDRDARAARDRRC